MWGRSNKKWGTQRDLYLGGPHSVLLGFNPPFSLILLNSEENKGGTRKGIKFWIERLIATSAGELTFRGTQLQLVT